MKSIFQALLGSDPKSTLIGVGLGALQAYGSHSIKQWAIAIGCALLGRVTNEIQAKYGVSNPQAGFSRMQAIFPLATLCLLLMAAPAFAGVARFSAKHIVAPAAKVVFYQAPKQTYHIGKGTAKVAKKVLY